MGDNIIDAQAKIIARITHELQDVQRQLQAENERLDARVRELESQLEQERAARRLFEERSVEYRRFAEKLFRKVYGYDIDMEAWENFRPEDYTLTIDDLLTEIQKIKE